MKTYIHPLILVIASLVAACSSMPQPVPQSATPPPPPNLISGCGGQNQICVAHLILLTPPPPKDRKERKAKAHSIYGHCQIIVDDAMSAGQTNTLPKTCLAVKISLTKKNTGEQRTEWLDGNDFNISGLSNGIYRLKVRSEQFQTTERLDKIKPGQELQIQIKLARKAEESAPTATPTPTPAPTPRPAPAQAPATTP